MSKVSNGLSLPYLTKNLDKKDAKTWGGVDAWHDLVHLNLRTGCWWTKRQGGVEKVESNKKNKKERKKKMKREKKKKKRKNERERERFKKKWIAWQQTDKST